MSCRVRFLARPVARHAISQVRMRIEISSTQISHESQEATTSLLREFVAFLAESKKWWLVPIVLVSVAALEGSSSTQAAPYIYSMF
jgi:Family of unknown function (DUF5989)